MKRVLLAVLLIVTLLNVADAETEKRINMENETGEAVLQIFEVQMESEYGQMNLSWQKPEFIKGNDTYTVAAEGLKGREFIRLYEMQITDTFFRATDVIAYVCQENGFYEQLRFFIVAYDDGKDVGYAYTETFDPRQYFPEKERLVYGEDVSMSDIRTLDVRSNGMAAEDNWSYFVVHDGSTEMYFNKAGSEERRITLNNGQWQKILDYLARGEIVRKRVMDPEIVILDGGEQDISVTWNGMKEIEESYYHVSLDAGDKQQLLDYLESLRSPSGLTAIVLTGVALASGAVIAVLRKLRK
jgi:hypothetical protein